MRVFRNLFAVCLCAGAVEANAAEPGTDVTTAFEPAVAASLLQFEAGSFGAPKSMISGTRVAQADDDQDFEEDPEFAQDDDDQGFDEDADFVDDGDEGFEEDPDVQDGNVQNRDQNQDAAPQPATNQTQPATNQAQPAAQGSVQQAVLARHNQLRARHCVPALTWSARLAGIAQDWANRCVFEHRPGNLGENLAMGTSGAFPPASHVQSWYDEIRSYDFATGASRDGQAVGHFTQVVWRTTTQLGCAVATCGGQDLLVCNYSPAGNLTGAYVQNVPQPCR